MTKEGYLLRKKIFAIACGSLLILLFSCAASNTPLILQQTTLGKVQSPQTTNDKSWVLDSLSPGDSTVFIRKQKTAISIYMEVHGDGNYLLQLSINGKCYSALPYSFIRGLGEIDFQGHIRWDIIPKKKVELISVALYRVEKSPSAKTQICTLLKQIKREYDVKCRKAKYNKPSPISWR